MKNCPKCNAQIPDNAAFCSECGAKMSPYQNTQNSPAAGHTHRLHCPRCKSTEITPITENVGSRGGVGRVTKNIAVTSTSNINQSFWMCHSCGHKFRNIDDLEAEISQRKRRQKIITGLTVFMLALLIFYFAICILVSFETHSSGSLIGSIIFDIIFGVPMLALWRYFSKKTKQMEELCAYLKQNCFD